MRIKAVKLYEKGYMQQAFAFGGSMPPDKIDMEKTYPSSLQNYVIDTGREVILVDTGLPKETPEFDGKPGQKLYIGRRIETYEEALLSAGYKTSDVSKIVVTHKHPDHTGELRLFPDAKIYISRTEAEAAGLDSPNIVRVDFRDGAYKNFSSSEKIAEHITMIPAPGHTTGNSIVIVEDGAISYMVHGDITYTDDALVHGQLSVVFEDRDAAARSLGLVRDFIVANDTVYLSTHTPEGIENLENKAVMKL